MSRIEACFKRASEQDRRLLIPYIAAGDPTPTETVPLLHTLVSAGADIIEIGVPFSDPIADGPVIQAAYERSLVHNTSLTLTLEMVTEFRRHNQQTAIVLMGYQNPIEVMGLERFAPAVQQAGVDGILTVDLPVEEAGETVRILEQHHIDPIFLLSPTTSEERVIQICKSAKGFIYYVSLKGVTGAGHLDIQDVSNHLAVIRRHTELPVCVGFGVKNSQTAAAIAKIADGVVVGSVFVNIIGQPQVSFEKREQEIAMLLSSMREAVDQSTVSVS